MTDWIALDWGTSNLRAFAMDTANEVIDQRASTDGMGGLAPEAFEAALLSLIEPWLGDKRMLILASGMVGARQGWVEAPYLSAPCEPFDPLKFVTAPAKDPRLNLLIAPGVSQTSPLDVMRGEETQIAGFLSANAKFDGVICLPGTHSKWVRISAGEIVGFRTFMTGEIFALLSTQSILRHSLDEATNEAAFAEAAVDALTSPEQIAARLFSLRAESLLSTSEPGAARARLSGWLIGMELAAARGWWLGSNVALIGAPDVTERYKIALENEGVLAPEMAANKATLKGLCAAKTALEATS